MLTSNGRLARVFVRALVLSAAMLCLIGARAANATEVLGRVAGYEHLRNPVWAEAKRAERHGYSFREPISTVPAQLRKLFPMISKEICIVASSDAGSGPGKAVVVQIAGGRTTPVTLVVAPGTELRFKNSDPFDHRLYGVGFDGLPASTIAKGADRRWTVKDRGAFEIRDELSPSIRSWVVSLPGTVATAFPAADGSFSISIDEPGLYTLQAYFSGKPVGSPLPVSVARRNVDVRARPLVLATQPPKEGKSP